MSDYSVYTKETVFFTESEVDVMIRSLGRVRNSGGTTPRARKKIDEILEKLQRMRPAEETKKEYLH